MKALYIFTGFLLLDSHLLQNQVTENLNSFLYNIGFQLNLNTFPTGICTMIWKGGEEIGVLSEMT